MITIKVKGKNIQHALKKFKRSVKESGHLEELKQRSYYLKPTTKRRLQKNKARRERERNLKELRKEGLHQ